MKNEKRERGKRAFMKVCAIERQRKKERNRGERLFLRYIPIRNIGPLSPSLDGYDAGQKTRFNCEVENDAVLME